MSEPFSIQSVKIPLFNISGAYEDLYGRPLDTARFETWDSVISSIKAAGGNDVMLIVSTGVMRNYNDNAFDPALSYNPDTESIRKLAELIKSKGMTVSISMFTHLENVISGSQDLQGQDRPYPTDKNLWMQNFSSSILNWAKFSQEINARAFLPFEDVTQHLVRDAELTAEWLQLISDIKSIYAGELSTVWWSPGEGNSITGIPASIIAELDYLGIGFFPELTKDSDATTEELIDAYYSDVNGHNVLEFIRGLSADYGKKIWITDKAFHSFDGAASDESRIFDSSIPLTQDLEEQARLYDSFLRVLSLEGGDWLEGVAFQSFNNIRDTSNLVARFVNGPLSESPQGKPALQILTDWFQGAKQGQGLGIDISGNANDLTLHGGYHNDTLTGGAGENYLLGHAGHDTLVGGSDDSLPVNVLKVDIEIRGVKSQDIFPIVSILDGDGRVIKTQQVTAQLVEGQAADSAAPTVITFYVNPVSPGFSINQENWEFFDFGPTGNRYVRVESIKVNDNSLSLQDTLLYVPLGDREQQAGAQDSVHGGKFVISPPAGISPVAVLFADNDMLMGGEGDDSLDGGSGLDVAVYRSARNNFSIQAGEDGFTVTDVNDTEGTDSLIRVERLKFSDHRVALDLQSSAGSVAKVLGVVFGPQSVSNKDYVGIGLSLMDAGMGFEELARLALQEALGSNPSNAQVVNLLYTNVAGAPPPESELLSFVSLIENGTYTQGSLAVMAADHELNTANIDLIGLAATGLDYIYYG